MEGVVGGYGKMSKPKILWLFNRKYYETRMSRGIFHSMDAISKIVDVTISGPGWPNYNNIPVHKNIKRIYKDSYPDLIVVYKPLEMKSFKGVLCPVCIRYDEMITDNKSTNYGMIEIAKEFTYSGVNLVICHYLNDMRYWKNLLTNRISKSFRFANIPHSAEKTIFKDYKFKKKKWDLLLIGKLSEFYPLRLRLKNILEKMSNKWRCHIWGHPGYDVSKAYNNSSLIEFAEAINSAKICCTCSSILKHRFKKYIEVPMCGSALAADFPDENHNFFRQFLIEIDMSMSDEEIINKLEYYLIHENERKKLIKNGLKLSKNYTQEDYAKRFIEITERFLKDYKNRSKYDQFIWFFKKRFMSYAVFESNFLTNLNNLLVLLDKMVGKVGIFFKEIFSKSILLFKK